MERKDFLDAKRYQLELILVGFALASTGDRKRILERMSDESLSRPSTRACISGIRSKDRNAVRDAFGAIVPVEDGKTLLDCLMDKLESMDREETVRTMLADIFASAKVESLEDVGERLETAMAFVRGDQE